MDTPQGIPYKGRRLKPGTQICGVSILRAGEVFETSLTTVCKDIRLGKILIQTNPDTLEPELHYLRLPTDIKVGLIFSLVLERPTFTHECILRFWWYNLDFFVESVILCLKITVDFIAASRQTGQVNFNLYGVF